MKTPEPYKTRHERGIEAIKQIIDDSNIYPPYRKVDRIARVIDEVEQAEPDDEIGVKARMDELGIHIAEGMARDIVKLWRKMADDPRFGELDNTSMQNTFSSVCKDRAEWMQKTLDERRKVSKLESVIEASNKLIDEYKETVENRDKTIALRGDVIKKQHETINSANKVIKDFKTIETRETDRLHKIIDELKDKHITDLKEITSVTSDHDIMLQNTDERMKDINRHYFKTIEDLKSTLSVTKGVVVDRNRIIEGLEYDLSICKGSGAANDLYIAGLKKSIDEENSIIDQTSVELHNCKFDKGRLSAYTDALETKLSARKQDSEVLMKVVEIVNRDDNCPTIVNQLADLLVDYLDAPEPLIDESSDMFEEEHLVDESRTVHLQKMRIAEQSKLIKRLVEEVKELHDKNRIDTYAYLEMP